MTNDERRFDIRTIERYVRDGIVSRDEFEEHLADLPDAADKAEKIEAQFVEGVLDDEEEDSDEDGEEVEEQVE